jgi:uncharacterized protein (DUF927 family)
MKMAKPDLLTGRSSIAEVIELSGAKTGVLGESASAHADACNANPSMPEQFCMAQDGLYVNVSQSCREEEADWVWICRPFNVLGRVRDPNGEGWARLLSWQDDDRREHRHAVSDAQLHGEVSALCADLASRGLNIVTGKHRPQLIHFLNNVGTKNRVTVVNKTGWHDISGTKVFALPNTTIGDAGEEIVIVESRHTAPFEARGTLTEWKAGVGSLIGDHKRATFAVSISFAGPLLGLVRMEGGGFNFYGQSSRGKSTLGQAAGSVWGKGALDPGFVCTWRATANALEATAALHSDSLLVLDELGVVMPDEAASVAYQLSAGSGKGRSARDGSLRERMTWRLMYISNGEVRISDKHVERGRRARAGQQIRLIDLPADAGKGFGVFDHGGADNDAKLLADAIKAAAQTFYGTAGPEFVKALMSEGIEKNAGMISDIIEAFRNSADLKSELDGADGQVRRGCDRFALVAAAGELAREFDIVPWEPGAALDAAKQCFRDWHVSRGGGDAAEIQSAISAVFIEQHGDSRFEPAAGAADHPVGRRAGWRKGEGAEREWLIPPEVWKSEVAAGQDPKLVARVLAERGMLRRAPDGFQCVERIQGRPTRVYVVKAGIISEPE